MSHGRINVNLEYTGRAKPASLDESDVGCSCCDELRSQNAALQNELADAKEDVQEHSHWLNASDIAFKRANAEAKALRERIAELEALTSRTVIRCHHCNGTLIYKREHGEFHIYHSCGDLSRIIDAKNTELVRSDEARDMLLGERDRALSELAEANAAVDHLWGCADNEDCETCAVICLQVFERLSARAAIPGEPKK